MIHLDAQIDAALSASPNYWQVARRGAGLTDGPDTVLPGCRTLPECEVATKLRAKGRAAYVQLFDMLSQETEDTRSFRNAVYLLLYFDSLFVYRELKTLYPSASEGQRPWLAAACRKILIRCLDVPEESDRALTREVVRNTEPGRLITTHMVVELSHRLAQESGRRIVIRDLAVSDGITTLDLAVAAVERSVPVAITGTDCRLCLRYAREGEDQVVADTSGAPLQYEISERTFGLRHDDPGLAPQTEVEQVAKALSGDGVCTVTMLAPEVELAIANGQFDLQFKEENAFEPHADIAEADIIRVANLFVERTNDHRGYYYRNDILRGMGILGSKAKDGAYLYLDNFRKKTEHVGLWRKNESAGLWERQPVDGDCAVDLAGVEDVPIGPRVDVPADR